MECCGAIICCEGSYVCTGCGLVQTGYMDMHDGYADVGRTSREYTVIEYDAPRIQRLHRQSYRVDTESHQLVSNFSRGLALSDGCIDWSLKLLNDLESARSISRKKYRLPNVVKSTCCIYYGCHLIGYDRTETELCAYAGIEKKEFRRCCTCLRELLVDQPYSSDLMSPLQPQSIVSRLFDIVVASLKDIHVPKYRILRDIEVFFQSNHINGTPSNVCARVILMFGHEYGITPKHIRESLGVSLI
jgi:hypothetical protein